MGEEVVLALPGLAAQPALDEGLEGVAGSAAGHLVTHGRSHGGGGSVKVTASGKVLEGAEGVVGTASYSTTAHVVEEVLGVW